MPPIERDAPRDADRALRHQHSGSSDHSRALIPMWDSSDPERAPPPLPLNPQSPSVASRAGTSAAIQSAHTALAEKARENALVPTLVKRMGEASPERSTPRGSSHRRMQSLQPGTVRDLSLMIEGGRDSSSSSTPRSPDKMDRPSTPLKARDVFIEFKADDKDEKALAASPRPVPSITPIVRPTVRRAHQSILGENTPPQSATMLALQTMQTPSQREPQKEPQKESQKESQKEPPSNDRHETALADITNSSTALVRVPQSLDSLSNQILSLTKIATALQKEMSQLSRRSRDNATDLMSLKEATNSRDEDIRKSLRDLMNSVSEVRNKASARDPYGGHFLTDTPKANHSTSPLSVSKFGKVSLPRIPSPTSFAASLDRETMSTPSLYGPDTPATIALLEKILREMGTKEGQEMLLARLAELSERLNGLASADKVDELRHLIQSTQTGSVVVPAAAGGAGGGGGNGTGRSRNFSFDDDDDRPRVRELDYAYRNAAAPITARVERLLQEKESRRSSAPAAQAADVINEDVLKIIRTVKDSVAQGGGLTAEVKALVRELRGEVLGMGREIGRRLEEVSSKCADKGETASKVEIAQIVEEGLAEMRQHINQLVKEHRRQSAASVSSRTSAVDYQEIYNAMRAALKDSQANKARTPELCREDVIEAVKEAWENYKPEIEIQQLGLEREEVLDCLKEGLQAYASRYEHSVSATRDEVFEAVVEGLKHFVPPTVETPATMSRDEILGAVRECLEEFEFPVAPSAIGAEISKEDMVDAVRQGLHGFDFAHIRAGYGSDFPKEDVVDAVLDGLSRFDFPIARGGELSRQDVVDAVREGLHSLDLSSNPTALSALAPSGTNEEIVSRLHEIMDYLRVEFKTVSEEAKQNVAANGRDTEQVLDATKDGFDKLRLDIESYIDRLAEATGHGDGLANSIDSLRAELADLVSRCADSSREVIRGEVEALREAVNSSLVPASSVGAQSVNHREILEALQEGLSSLRTEIGSRPLIGVNEILDALQEGLGDLRISIDKLRNKPADLTANDEILDALKSGLDGVKSEIDVLREESKSDRALAPISANAIVPADVVKHDDIKNLEGLIAELRVQLEGMQQQQQQKPASSSSTLSKEDLDGVESMLHNIRESLNSGMPSTRDPPGDMDPASREDVQAIETILRNTKARLDDLMDGEQAVRKEHLDILEGLLLETRESLGTFPAQLDSLSRKEDITAVESLVTQVVAAFDEMKERHEKALEDPERVTKSDVEAVEAACLDVKSAIEQMVKSDLKAGLAGLPGKDDFERVLKTIQDTLESQAEAHAKAFEERQAETVGVGERVSEVKALLDDLQGVVRGRLEDGATGMDSISKMLDAMSETIAKNANVSDDLKEMFTTMKDEFEESKSGVVGAKLETDEKFQQMTELLVGKFDDRIGELLTKYEELQLVLDDRAAKGETRDIEVEAAVVGTKAVADELKSLVDALGSAVTDSLEKMEEASKTVFTRVEDLLCKSEDNHSDNKAEHQLTRDQVSQAVNVVEGLQGHVVEYQPKILETIKAVLDIVGQHYEHSKTSILNIQEKIEEAKAPEQPLLPPVEKYDDTGVHEKLDRLVEKCDNTAVHAKLDRLVEKSDDAGVHEKLDKLVDHTEVADKAFTQLETLDKVHQQVLQTAAEISAFMAAQTKRIEDEHEDREKTLQETTIAVERRKEEKLFLESSIAELREEAERLRREHQEEEERFRQSLRQEEERLKQSLRDQEERFKASLREEEERMRESIRTLQAEQEALARQKTRLSADVSSLETALRLRREELHDMESRAEGLERRILEGVMDHSRVLLMAKANRATGGRDAMSRKRVPSQKTAVPPPTSTNAVTTIAVAADSPKSKPQAALNMALSGNRSLAKPKPNGQARRILSLSQIANNAVAGGVKRSQSVKTAGGKGALRKSSWTGGGGRIPGAGAGAAKGYGDLDRDKENMALKESDEEHDEQEEQGHMPPHVAVIGPEGSELTLQGSELGQPGSGDDDASDTETLRRSSRGTTVITGTTESYIGTEDEDEGSYYSDDGDSRSEWTEGGTVRTESVVSEDDHGGHHVGGNEVVLFQQA
ncbi:hypothetical protein VTK73DRAFT_1163 [Phialemonium thermophilum]|uniref:Uncharacterized protein n=1 Tax=Phialemonium thermophilum TaxID=223376 RepID=A0ABR3XAR7_9PEZI